MRAPGAYVRMSLSTSSAAASRRGGPDRGKRPGGQQRHRRVRPALAHGAHALVDEQPPRSVRRRVGGVGVHEPRGRVEAEVVGDGKEKKIYVFKFKRRKNYRRKTGHRQKFTEVRITDVKVG